MTIDETDKKIINCLLENSRLSYRQIAKKIHVSVATVMHRVNALTKEGIITGFTTIVDYEKLGYDVDVIIYLRIIKGKLFDVEKKVSHHPNVVAVYDITGDFDALILAKFKTRREVDAFVKKIQTYDFIEKTNTILVLNTIKEKRVQV